MIAVACDEDGVVALDVAEGQRNDAPLAEGVLIDARHAVGTVREVLGDKGFTPTRSATSSWTTSTPCR